MIKKFERILLILLVIGNLLNILWPHSLTPLLAAISVLLMICGFQHLGLTFKWATVIFFILGLLIVIFNQFSLSESLRAINSMDNLVVLLVVMQLFTIPIAVGDYQRSIVELVDEKLPTNKGLFGFTMLTTFLLSSILSMGTVPIIYSVLGPTIQKRTGNNYKRFSSVAISRAFTLGTLWAPGAATIFLISTITHVSLQTLFIPSFFLGLLGLLLSWLIEQRAPLLNGEAATTKNKHSLKALNRVVQIITAVAILLIIAFSLIHFKIGEAMIDVATAGILVVFSWCIFLQKEDTHHHETIKAGRQYFSDGLLRGGSLAPFFIAIGFFSSTFEHSSISSVVGEMMSPFIVQLSWGSLILIPLLVVILSLIGIHPLASVTLLGQIMMQTHLPFSALAVALSLNIGSVLSYMMSPFAGIVVVIANILGISSATVSLKWNGRYCIKLLALSLIFIVAYTLII